MAAEEHTHGFVLQESKRAVDPAAERGKTWREKKKRVSAMNERDETEGQLTKHE